MCEQKRKRERERERERVRARVCVCVCVCVRVCVVDSPTIVMSMRRQSTIALKMIGTSKKTGFSTVAFAA